MYQQLRIEGDPTTWVLSQPIADTAPVQSGQPFQADISAPLAGTLILSGRAAASVVLYDPPSGGDPSGVIPSGVSPLTPCLYLPSAAGLSHQSPGYPLPVGSDLPALASEITAAMSQDKSCTVAFGSGAAGGELVLNGAALPFAVLVNPTASG